jgi:hypothetical protein
VGIRIFGKFAMMGDTVRSRKRQNALASQHKSKHSGPLRLTGERPPMAEGQLEEEALA